jgi:hypothetical protein
MINGRGVPLLCPLIKAFSRVGRLSFPRAVYTHSINYRLLKKSQGPLCAVGSVSVVQPSCCFALVYQSPGFHWVTSGQCWKSKLQCFTCKASFCQKLYAAKMLRQQKTGTFFNFCAFSTLCYTLQSCTCSTPSCYYQGRVCFLFVCDYSILTCIITAVASIYQM